jgi:hypothetical protein
MPLTSALLVTLALSAGPERVLLCRPAVLGDPALARAEALSEAVRPLQDLFLDYGVACESLGEAARAAARAGLGHGVFCSAEGQAEGARYTLVLGDALAAEVARRTLLFAPGSEAAGALRVALEELEGTVPRPPARWPRVAAWTLVGVGVASLVAGTLLAARARDQAQQTRSAATPEAYQAARDGWQRDQSRGVAALALGGGALAAGLVFRFAF